MTDSTTAAAARRGPRARRRPLAALLNKRVALAALKEKRSTAHHRPMNVTLQVASACNLDCYMCSEHNRPEGQKHGQGLVSMSREVFDRVDEELLPYARTLTIGMGGEPTISKDFVEYLDRARARGVEIHLVTNGTQFGREGVARAVAESVSYLRVSIDAATEENYERIRIGSRWKALRKSLDALNERRLAHPAGERTHLSLCYVLMKSNVHELPAFVELADELEAEEVHAQHVIPVTEEGKSEPLIDEPERYAHFRRLAAERAAELGIVFDAPLPYATAPACARRPGTGPDGPATESPSAEGPKAESSTPAATPPVESAQLPLRPIPCTLATLDVFVTYDGRITPCCHPYAHRKMTMGNVRTQSLAEIWDGRVYRRLRAGIRSGDAPQTCRTCSVVHDPPPAYEDPDALEAQPEITHLYADAPVPAEPGASLRHRAYAGALRVLRRARGTA